MQDVYELARSAGYNDVPHGVELPDHFRVVRPGDVFLEGDWFFDNATKQWLPHTVALGVYSGETITPDWSIVIRPIPRGAGAGARWSCGHGRDPGAKYCIVCHVFMRYVDS